MNSERRREDGAKEMKTFNFPTREKIGRTECESMELSRRPAERLCDVVSHSESRERHIIGSHISAVCNQF